jgi:hypothetical protein
MFFSFCSRQNEARVGQVEEAAEKQTSARYSKKEGRAVWPSSPHKNYQRDLGKPPRVFLVNTPQESRLRCSQVASQRLEILSFSIRKPTNTFS